MQPLSLATVMSLLERSERTLWRRIAEGSLTRAAEDARRRTMIHADAITSEICIPLEPEDFPVIERADEGDAEAQADLAVIFLSNSKPESAIYWLQLAAKQDHPHAMYLLGRCYIDGTGLAKDENHGIMWIAKAAAHGDLISREQMQAILAKLH
ncbi:MAG: sel1 repeat family protein [Pseudomonadota bacterium]